MRDHGGDLDRAKAAFGGGRWLDLSTGINPVAYPVPGLSNDAWTRLPEAGALRALINAARAAYDTPAEVVPLSGAQAAIQLVPRLRQPGRAAVVGPTYNEHAAALRAQGWQVDEVSDIDQAAGADLAVVVNPNNPDGRIWTKDALTRLKHQVGALVVDESFADPSSEFSVASDADDALIVLRSFGKFYGLAGVRLGFAITGGSMASKLRSLSGPWPVSGPAIAVGTAALSDQTWQMATRARLAQDAVRLDALADGAGWKLVGGTALFRTYRTGGAGAAQMQLAEGRVWSRIFPYSDIWIRLGLPGSAQDWAQLGAAL